MKGFEPSTPGTTNRCSNQLSYIHHESARARRFWKPVPWGLGKRYIVNRTTFCQPKFTRRFFTPDLPSSNTTPVNHSIALNDEPIKK